METPVLEEEVVVDAAYIPLSTAPDTLYKGMH